MKLTQKQVRVELAKIGVSFFRDGQDFRVRLIGSPAGDGYFAATLSDALDTGRAMAKERDGKAVKHTGSAVFRAQCVGAAEAQATEQRETFTEFLTRCGKDQRESGRDCTADDYDKAAARITELETLIAEMVKGYKWTLLAMPDIRARSNLRDTLTDAETALGNRFQHLA